MRIPGRVAPATACVVLVVAALALTAGRSGGHKQLAQPSNSGPPTAATVTRLRVEGENLVGPDGAPILLRGLNFGWWGEETEADAEEAKAMGANVVRLPLRWY